MKFRFCGGLDAPDWLLTEVAIVAKLSSQQVTFLSEQVVRQLMDKSVDFGKLQKILESVKFSRSDVKAALAATNYIFDRATRYSVERKILNTEMQQLGLHENLTEAMLNVYFSRRDALHAVYKEKEFKLDTIKGVDWRVDCILGSSNVAGMAEPNVKLNIESSGGDTLPFDMSSNTFDVLHAELKNAHAMMMQMDGEKS
eukprot:g141.t1